jgi:hypothetical protein
VFFFNLDLWDFTKVHTVYQSQTQAYADPNSIPFYYFGYALTWHIIALLAPLIYVTIYLIIPRLPNYGPLDIILSRAKLTRAFLFIAQILAIPFGVAVVKQLGCQNYPNPATGTQQFRSIVYRDTQCLSAEHLSITIPMVILFILYFTGLATWMVWSIQRELVSPLMCTYDSWWTHERNLQLKEAEFVQEIDLTWSTHHYSIFSSFHRLWVWYRPFSFFIKAIILTVYGGMFYWQQVQTITLFAIACFLLLLALILPVYRVRIFNFMLVFSIFIHLCNLALGMLLIFGVQNALLYGQNLINFLLVINLSWGIVAAVWLAYIYLRSRRIIGKRLGPLWPVLPELDSTNLSRNKNTKKFFKALLSGRRILESCYSSTEFFAPTHELSRQIQIINAYCREAEVLEDPAHSSLWALLAEMVDAHSMIAPLSVYGTSVKDSVPQKVIQLMELIPAFRKRLEQREYDFILWTPSKRRILLKLLVVATFLRRRNMRINIPIDISYLNLRGSDMSPPISLSDDCEWGNDRFIIDIDKWDAMRKKASPSDSNRFPSIGSLQTDDKTYQVELWEDGQWNPSGGRVKQSLSIQSISSNDTVDKLLDEVEDLQQASTSTIHHEGPSPPSMSPHTGNEEGSSNWEERVLSPSILVGRRSTRSAGNKFNVRFNILDTITEQEAAGQSNSQSRPSSTLSSVGSSTDRLIEGVEKNFPRNQQ